MHCVKTNHCNKKYRLCKILTLKMARLSHQNLISAFVTALSAVSYSAPRGARCDNRVPAILIKSLTLISGL